MPILVSLQPLVKCPAIQILLLHHSIYVPIFRVRGKILDDVQPRPYFPKILLHICISLEMALRVIFLKEKRFTQASVLPEILLPIFAKDLLQFFSGFFHPCIFKAPEVIKCSFVAVSSQIEPIICIQSLYDQVQFLKN